MNFKIRLDNLYIKFKSYLPDILIFLTLILHLNISVISNYTLWSLFLKLFTALLFTGLLLVDGYKKKIPLKAAVPPKILKAVLLLAALPLLSLVYSYNKEFGIQKLIHLIVGAVPLVIGTYYLLITNDKTRLKLFAAIILGLAVLASAVVLVASPFTYDGIYSFFPSNWSHVVMGRFLALAILINSIILIDSRKALRLTSIAINMFLIYVLFFTALRSAVVALAATLLILAAYHFKNKKIINPSLLLLTFLFPLIVSYSLSDKMISSTRYESLQDINKLEFKGDGAIISRIDAWKSAWSMIKEKPVFGWGLGGYKTETAPNNWIKYPHNIFLEIQVELGIIGTLLFLFYLIKIFSKSPRLLFPQSPLPLFPYFRLLLLMAFILAFFSKDIATNPLLWLGLLLIAQDLETKRL
jgi:O-antigen ligase